MNFRSLLLVFLFLLALSPEFRRSFEPQKRLGSISPSPLVNSYLTGQKRGLTKDLKTIHQELNLQHLMTPSGLHLASLLLILGLFFKGQKIQFSFLLVLGALVWPYTGLDSFKRMILFGLLRKNPLKPLTLKTSFILTFVLAFITGQYFKNPLSFSLSFIFIGALILSRNRLYTFILLGFIQIIIGNWFESTTSPMGIILGLTISMISPIVFPLFILESIFPALPFSFLWEGLLKFMHQLLLIKVELLFLPLIPFFFFIRHEQLKRPALALSLLLTCLPLGHRPTSSHFSAPPPKQFSKSTSLHNGSKFLYDNGMRCYSRLKGDQWSHHCYK